MTICERCETENLDGSRYCDACGAALWLAGRPGQVSPNGKSGNLVAVPAGSKVARASAEVALVQHQEHARLVIERGRSAGKQFPLSNDEAHIGRWDADGGIFPDVDLDDDDPEAKVSRRHARILRVDGEYIIEDVGSKNGTFVNRGRRLTPGERQTLRDGDEIIVGKTFLRFRVTR